MTILEIIKSFIKWHIFLANTWYYQSKLLPLKQNKYDLIIKLKKSKNIFNCKLYVWSKIRIWKITTHPKSNQTWPIFKVNLRLFRKNLKLIKIGYFWTKIILLTVEQHQIQVFVAGERVAMPCCMSMRKSWNCSRSTHSPLRPNMSPKINH